MCKYSIDGLTTHGYQGTNNVTQQTSHGLFSIASIATLSRVSALVSVASIFSFATPAMAAPANSQPAVTTNGPTIYKLVDASGRITYTNSPTKGAIKVELDPITVIPSSPAGMLGGGQAGAQANLSPASQSKVAPELIPVGIAPSIAKPEAPTMPLMPIASPAIQTTQPTFAASARAVNVQPATAVVTPVLAVAAQRVQSPPAQVVDLSAPTTSKLPVVKLSPRDDAPRDMGIRLGANTDTSLGPATTAASVAPVAPTAPINESASMTATAPVILAVANAQEIKPPPSITQTPQPATASTPSTLSTISPKFEKEGQLLATLKAQLIEQQNQSASFRAMRARLPTTIDQSDPTKADIQNDIKAQVELHFERIRGLQDQIAQREQNLAVLRQ